MTLVSKYILGIGLVGQSGLHATILASGKPINCHDGNGSVFNRSLLGYLAKKALPPIYFFRGTVLVASSLQILCYYVVRRTKGSNTEFLAISVSMFPTSVFTLVSFGRESAHLVKIQLPKTPATSARDKESSGRSGACLILLRE
jgi:hypothetical protein